MDLSPTWGKSRRNAACRRCPPVVQLRNSTSARSRGTTQWRKRYRYRRRGGAAGCGTGILFLVSDGEVESVALLAVPGRGQETA